MTDSKKPGKGKNKKVTKNPKARGLGRGLSALMADVSVPMETDPANRSSMASNMPNSSQPPNSMEGGAIDVEALGRGSRDKSGKKRGKNRKKNAGKNSGKNEGKAAPSTAALVPDSKQVQFIGISRLERNPDQPRKIFNEEDLAELTSSIRQKGVLQPILVRPIPPSKRSKDGPKNEADFQIVAGERRWQASLKAGLTAMPVLIRDLSDVEVLEIGVVENVQRADLNPIEEARAYRSLIDDFGRTQADVAEAIGKSRSHIANLLRMLDMPLQIQRWLELGKLSLGHAKAIISMPDPIEVGDMILREGLSVRATEAYVKRYKDGSPHILGGTPHVPAEKDPNIVALEQKLTDILGLIVDLRHKGPSGELRIKYKSGAQLDEVVRRLKG